VKHLVWIAILIRLIFGLVFLAYGLDKLIHFDTTVNTMVSNFRGTWIPGILVRGFVFILPFAELGLGVLYLIGYRYRETLIATGVLMALLTFGLAVRGEADGVARNLVYFFILLIGLWHSEANRFAVSFSKER